MSSEVGDTIADKLLTSERSYRKTLLRLRHGVDLARLLCNAADKVHDDAFTAFLDGWRRRREPLAEEVVAQLAWFAERPARAHSNQRAACSPSAPPE